MGAVDSNGRAGVGSSVGPSVGPSVGLSSRVVGRPF